VIAKPEIKTIIQLDNKKLSIILRGDEYLHTITTLDGIPLVDTEKGYYYANVVDCEFVASPYIAHNEDERSADEINFVNKSYTKVWNTFLEKYNKIRNRANLRRGNRNMTRSNIGISSLYVGKKKGLVIMVSFENRDFGEGNPAEIKRMFNEKGYSGNNHIGSVHDYFYDQSYGQFDLSFDVLGPVKLEHTYGYYGTNLDRQGNGGDKYVGRMVMEACQALDGQIDFGDYDWDGDGEVDQVFFIYAGYGESTGGNSTTIWPHESSLTSYSEIDNAVEPIFLDGVKIDTYACANELDGSNGNKMMGIGVACHEFSHCLGLPDLYDVNYNGGFGMNVWDVMDAGSHSGPKGRGEVPYGYSAYERWFVGWLAFKEILSTQKISNVHCLSEKPEAYIIRNDGWNNEFYIIENHQDKGWYQYTGTTTMHHGLMVTHVDFDQDAWAKNRVNAENNHQRMSIIPADNDFGDFYSFNSKSGFSPNDEDLAGDLFPGIRNVTELTNTSHENVGGRLFNPNLDGSFFLNKSITNIVENNGDISFDVLYLNSFDGIEQISTNNENDFIIYNIKGQKVTHPSLSGMYIFKKNGIFYKKIINY